MTPARTPGGVETFMATMVAQAQPVALERALAVAREGYGLEGEAVRMTGERDENFRLTARDGAQYVLKVANPAEPAEVIDLQITALLHLEATSPALPCPRVRRTHEGATQVRFQDEAGVGRSARLLTYLPGTLLGASRRSAMQRAGCGRLGAQLALALRQFRHPAAHRAVIWDVRHTPYLRELLGQMPTFAHRDEVGVLLSHIVPAIEAQLPGLRQQVVHNDLNPLNLLVNPQDEDQVSGVFDFGDITHTALIGDVAVAAAELIPGECTAPDAARACVLDVVSAYHGLLPLLAAELRLLNRLVAARLLMNVVVHEWHVHHNPANRHYAPLDEGFMRGRFAIATALLREEIRL
ncbi:MAG: phosphotransferase [Gammaproteobacteria bacterium]|nr:phosphotransferase [Gammaproteobacteria bacterium]